MSQLVASFMENLVVTLLLGASIFGGLIYLFARADSAAFIVGLLRTLWSIASSPVVYLRSTIESLARYGRGVDEAGASDQFLLNRLMKVLQAVIVVAAITIITGGLVGAWKTLVPPRSVRESYKQARESLATARENLTNTTTEVQQLDTAWTNSQERAMANARAPHSQALREASAGMKSAEETARQWAGAAAGVLADLSRRASEFGTPDPGDDYGIQRTKNSLEAIVGQQWYSLTDEDRSLLNAWIGRWEAKVLAEQRLAAVTPEAVRREVQPRHLELAERKAALEADVADREATAKTLKAAASLRVVAAFWSLLKTAIVFLFTIWAYGLLLEGLWIVIHVAGDVKRIRSSTEAGSPRTSAVEPRIPLVGTTSTASAPQVAGAR